MSILHMSYSIHMFGKKKRKKIIMSKDIIDEMNKGMRYI